MSTGIGTPNLPPSSILDEVLGNRTIGGVKTTVRVPLGAITNGLTGTSIYVIAATKSELDGLLNYDANVGGQVVSDPVSANNGVYQKLGASGTGSWKRIGNLSADAAAISATQAGNSKDAAAASAASAAASAATLPSGGPGYTTQAALNADLSPPANTIRQVIADPATPTATTGNGTYRKVGASGTGTWTKVSDASVVGLDARTKRLGARLSLTGDRHVERDSLNQYVRHRADGRILGYFCAPDGVPYLRSDLGLDPIRINRGLDGYGLPYAEAYRPEWMREAHHRLGILGAYGGLRAGTNCQFAMLFQGDSWSTNAAYYIAPLARFLAARYGDAGPGYVGFGFSGSETINGNARPEAVAVVKTGAWASTYGTAPMPDHSMVTSGGAGDTYTLTYTKTTGAPDIAAIDLFAIAGGTNAQYRFNGGAWTAIDLSGSGFKLVTIATVPAGTFTLDVQALGAGAQIGGVNLRSTAKGVVIHKAGSSATRSAQWASANAAIYQAALAALAPHSVSILGGTNSQRLINGVPGYDGDTERGYLQTLVGRIRAALPVADVVLVTPPENASAANAYPMSDYAAAHRRLAYDTGVAHLDLQPAFGDAVALYQDGSPRGWLDNTLIHPSTNNGGLVIADRYAGLLGAGDSGVTAADIKDSSATGRAVLTAADAAAGATALGLGTGNSPTWTKGTFSGGVTVSGSQLDFNFRTGALINLFGSEYSMGIQTATAFIRTNTEFCVYAGGSFASAQADPGVGGTRLIRANSGMVEVGARLGLPAFTVGTLPAGSNGSLIYVSNARKVGEAAGSGTGVVAYYSNNSWRRQSDDVVVAA